MNQESFYNIHSCDAVVLSCIDFRFWEKIVNFVKNDLKIKDFDFPSLPGACKDIVNSKGQNELAMKCISVPIELHHAKTVVIINYADCGAYGSASVFDYDIEKEQKYHENELLEAKNILLKKFPNVNVILVFAKLVDDAKNIKFVRIS